VNVRSVIKLYYTEEFVFDPLFTYILTELKAMGCEARKSTSEFRARTYSYMKKSQDMKWEVMEDLEVNIS
jgi:hypothetical protein